MMQLLRTLQPNLENPVGPETRAMLAGLRRAPKKLGRGQQKGLSYADGAVLYRHERRYYNPASVPIGAPFCGHGLRNACVIAFMSDGLLRTA